MAEKTKTRDPNPKNVGLVAEVKHRLELADTVIAAEYRGLNVPQQAELRAKVRAAGGEIKIYKNTLVRRAAAEAGVELGQYLTGPTALALTIPADGEASDPAALAKALQDFADAYPFFVIKGGVMDGAPLNGDSVRALSKIPSRDVLLSQVAGIFAAPMVKFASLLQAMPRDLASLIKALQEKGGAGGSSVQDTVVGDVADTVGDDAATGEPILPDAVAGDSVRDDVSADADEPKSEEAPASDEAAEAAGSGDAAEESEETEAAAPQAGGEEQE